MLYPSLSFRNLWTPKEINTDLWLDASDTSTLILSGSSVQQWNDKSGNDNHVLQPTPGKRPQLNGTEVAFDGVDDMLVASNPVLTSDFSGSFTMFSASRLIDDDGYLYGAVGSDGTGIYQREALLSLANTLSSANFSSIYHNLVDVIGVIGVVYDNTSRMFSVNGDTNVGSYAYTFGTPTALFTIGNRQIGTSSTTYWGGSHSEIIVVNEALSVDNRQKLEGYLAHKWGLVDYLPVTHPYKNKLPRK